MDTQRETDADKLKGKPKKELSTDVILSQCVLFFLAGFETTASSLAYTAYLLALNPECQNKLLIEIDAAVRENKGILSVENISQLPYLDAVVKESLRLYPSFSYLLRTCSSPCHVSGIPFRPGMMVNIPIYAIHRDAKYFHHPDDFVPERFLAENKSEIAAYTYLPFGEGPRNCLGMRFAILEMKAALAHALRFVQFEATEDTKKPLKMFKGKSFLTAEQVPIRIINRNN